MHRTDGSAWNSEMGVGSVQSRNLIRCELPWTEKRMGKGGLLRRKDVQGTRYELRQKGRDWLEGDRKIWKEVQPSADVQTLATVLLISSDVCQGTKGKQ